MTKKICLTGIKPTGTPHLGNYIGMIRPALELAEKENHEAYYFIADYHAIITIHDKKKLEGFIHEVAASWLALGLNPSTTTLYLQSHIPEITELAWILSCVTPKGLLNRAHAYKAALDINEAEKRDPDYGVNLGLYNYPVLMASDILFIKAHYVPVGSDQIQHIEIARDIAKSFNHKFGNILRLPEAMIQEKTKLVPGTDGRKMSKSYGNIIPLFLSEKKLRKEIMKIPTDSLPPAAPKNPDSSFIFQLFEHFGSESEVNDLRAAYEAGISWGDAKQQLFEKLNSVLAEPREKYEDFLANPFKIKEVLEESALRIRPKAKALLNEIKEALGLHPF
jgi:tryptophanyl-tRNA synthetase